MNRGGSFLNDKKFGGIIYMGLYCQYDILENPAFNAEVSAEIMEVNEYGNLALTGEYETMEVDYSNALDLACAKFEEVVHQLVPVDTGHLSSSIRADHDGRSTVFFYAKADYAQYVEFGTWKMSAQEYFRPAVEEALDILLGEASAAQAWATEMVQALAGNIFYYGFGVGAAVIGGDIGFMEAVIAGKSPMTAMSTQYLSTGGFIGGLIGGIFMLALSFVPMVYLYGVFDAIGTALFVADEKTGEEVLEEWDVDIDDLIEIVDF